MWADSAIGAIEWNDGAAPVKRRTLKQRGLDVHPHPAFRAQSERIPASGPCLFGVAQSRHGARAQRTAAAAHRGHRCEPLAPGIRNRDLRRSRLAWYRLGTAGAAAE